MKKLLSLLIAAILLLSLSPFMLFADSPGASIDNPYIVSSFEPLQAALDNSEYTFVATSGMIDGYGHTNPVINVPSGKTLIIDGGTYNAFYFANASIIVRSGATLIIQSGINLGPEHTISSWGGTIINYGLILNSVIMLNVQNCTLNNETSGVITERNAILFDSRATIQNSGQIDCFLYYDEFKPSIDGVPANRIGQLQFSPDDFSDIPLIDATEGAIFPIIIEDSIGLPDDGSFADILLSNNDSPHFMRIYKITLESGQVLSLQRSGNFSPAMYIAEGNPDNTLTNIRFVGYHFIADQNIVINGDSQRDYYVFVAGYNLYDTGHFSLSIHRPEQSEQIAFFDPNAPTSGPGWSWDNTTNTLTLDNFTYSGDPNYFQEAINLPENSHIILADGSQNYIRTHGPAIRGRVNLSISGGGSLTINSGAEGIILSDNPSHLDIYDVHSLSIDAQAIGIRLTNGSLSIQDCQEIRINAGDNSMDSGIQTGREIFIIRSNLWVSGNRYGIVSNGNINIDESYIQSANVFQYGRGPITSYGEQGISLIQCKLIYPEDAQLLDLTAGSGQTFSIHEDPSAPGYINDLQYAVKFLQISPAYTLDYDANGGMGDSDSLSGFYVRNEVIAVADTPFHREGFAFNGWNTMSNGTGDDYILGDSITVSANTVLYAQWLAEYTVRFIDWNGNVLSEQIVFEGDSATSPTSPIRDGFIFVGWNQSFDSVTENMEVLAVYRAEDVIVDEDDSDDSDTPTSSDENNVTDPIEETSENTDIESTDVSRTGQTRTSILVAIGCILLGGAFITVFVMLKKRQRIE